MADLAIVFHWSPEECADFSLRELMEWRERARKRSTPSESRSQRGA
ncbi:GpE family phage tail protein [Halomonas sp. FeN2]|nr:GpE family phage tail protein [Halomonas sp. FeN2]UBR49179.1 GpE family phage tail protein [Halomonas sp. FeN2]